jgi:hypothetical protein
MPAVQMIHIFNQFLNQSEKNKSLQRCSVEGFMADQPGQFLTT